MSRVVSIPHQFNGLAGCVTQRRNRQTGHTVSLYHAEQAGLDPSAGAWVTTCEEHGQMLAHPRRGLAERHLSDPAGWCSKCQASRPNTPDSEE